MEVQDRNGVKTYSLCTGKPLPAWLGERARRNLSKRDDSIRERLSLLQDFEFNSSSSVVRQSPDGNFIAATGTYRPSIKMFMLSDLGMKFERRLDSEAIDFLFLSEDYGKMAILEVDRTVELHAPYGSHHKMRIPTFGRKVRPQSHSTLFLFSMLTLCFQLAYEAVSTSLLVTSSGGGVYRINLEEGRFSEPLEAPPKSAGTTCIAISPTHKLTCVGSEDGQVRFFDARVNDTCSPTSPFVSLDIAGSTSGYGFFEGDPTSFKEVTSCAFSNNGLNVAFGTKGGCVALYDVRSSKPLHIKEHQYGLPIHTVQFHEASESVMSADKKIIKSWKYSNNASFGSGNGLFGGNDFDDAFEETTTAKASKQSDAMGAIVCNIEGEGDLNHFIVGGDSVDPTGKKSGLVLCAGEQSRVQAFYCPALGNAPRWCSFLDNITEELEQHKLSEDPESTEAANVYDDYKFLSREEVTKLGIDNLVGTPLLRGYMHGFFIDAALYTKVKSVANPFEYEEYRKKKIKEKIEAKTASRITPKTKKVVGTGVNKELAERLESKSGTSKDKKAGKAAKSLLGDSRFGSLFENADFAINEESQEFKLRNPSGVAARKFGNEDEDMDSDRDEDSDKEDEEGEVDLSGFDKVGDSWGGEESDHASGDESDASEENVDGFMKAKVRGDRYEAMKKMEKEEKKERKEKKKKAGKRKQMFEASNYEEDGALAVMGDNNAAKKMEARELESEMDLGSRVKGLKENEKEGAVNKKMGGSGKGVVREFVYTPKKKVKPGQEEEEKKSEKRERRGTKDLKLSKTGSAGNR